MSKSVQFTVEELRDAANLVIRLIESGESPFIGDFHFSLLQKFGGPRATETFRSLLAPPFVAKVAYEVQYEIASALARAGERCGYEWLLKELTNPYWYLCIKAAASLSAIGYEPEHDEVRVTMLLAQGRLSGCARFGDAAVAPLIRALEQETPTFVVRDEEVVAGLARELAQIPDRRAGLALVACYEKCRVKGVLNSLRQFPEAAALHASDAVAKLLVDRDTHLRWCMYKRESVGTKVDELIAICDLAGRVRDDYVVDALVTIVHEHRGNPSLKTDGVSRRICDKAMDTLAQMGDRAADALRKFIVSDRVYSDTIRELAAKIVADHRLVSAVPALLATLEKWPSVGIVDALVRLQATQEQIGEVALRLSNHWNSKVREVAAYAFQSTGYQAQNATERALMAVAMGHFETAAAEGENAIAALAPLLRAPMGCDATTQVAVVRALAMTGSRAAAAHITSGLQGSGSVFDSLVDALVQLGGPIVEDALIQKLHTPDDPSKSLYDSGAYDHRSSVVPRLARALAEIGGDKALRELIKLAAPNMVPHVQWDTTYESMRRNVEAEVVSIEARALPVLLDSLTSTDSGVSFFASTILAQMGNVNAVDTLLRFAAHDYVCHQAVYILEEFLDRFGTSISSEVLHRIASMADATVPAYDVVDEAWVVKSGTSRLDYSQLRCRASEALSRRQTCATDERVKEG
jgi:HEAT repeat protein